MRNVRVRYFFFFCLHYITTIIRHFLELTKYGWAIMDAIHNSFTVIIIIEMIILANNNNNINNIHKAEI